MSYSHMGRPHTTIGDASFHFRVRDGIGWFQYSMAARQTGMKNGVRDVFCSSPVLLNSVRKYVSDPVFIQKKV